MRTVLPLLLLAWCLAGPTKALDLLDPTAIVDELSQQFLRSNEGDKKPDFCGKMECPPFETKEHTDNYDVREYEGGKWLMTNVSDTKFELAYTKAAARLLKYFKGSNEKGDSFDVTTPTLAELSLDRRGRSKDKDYSFSLWIPKDLQDEPPQPTDSEVKIVEFPSITVYVRIFGGFATEGTILKEARSLQDILEDDDRDYADDVVYAAVYDPPQKLLRRHNEVHIPYASKMS